MKSRPVVLRVRKFRMVNRRAMQQSSAVCLIIAAQIFMICEYAMDASAVKVIQKPTIEPAEGLKLQPGDTAKLECRSNEVGVNMSWQMQVEDGSLVTVQNSSRITINSAIVDRADNNTQKVAILQLTIARSETSDIGKYMCNVTDRDNPSRNNYNSVPVDVGNFIKFSPSMHALPVTRSGKRCTIYVDYRSNPEYRIYWTKDDIADPLMTGEKYNITSQPALPWQRAKLIINETATEDTGSYTLHVDTGVMHANYTRNLTVESIPKLSMDSRYSRPNEMVSFECVSIGIPKPNIRFAFFPCNAESWINCSRSFDKTMVNQHGQPIDHHKIYEHVERYSFPASNPGFVVCHAQNGLGNAWKTADLLIGELELPVVIGLESPEKEVTVGDDVTLDCAAPVYNTTAIEFYRDDALIGAAQKGVLFENRYENYAYRRTMTIGNIQRVGEEVIKCRAFWNDSTVVESDNIILEVHEPVRPSIRGGNESEDVELIIGDLHKLECEVDGMPRPLVQWFKDGQAIGNGTKLEIVFGTSANSGEYFCKARNKMGVAEKKWTLKVKTVIIRTFWIYFVVSLLTILLLVVILTTTFYFKKKNQVKVLKQAGLANFEEGNLEQMNPEVPLEEQADLLPYKREFEFPKEKLKLGRQLGAGAFGVVMKATAYGIKPGEAETPVAVKMVRKLTDNIVMRSLILELKIMIHMGQHLNVVNLLGAVTKDIAKRELMVIVEYCHFGNIQHFLLKNRTRFVDQMNLETGEIDFTLDNYQSDDDTNNSSKSSEDTKPPSSDYISAPNSNSTGITFINDSYVNYSTNYSSPKTTDTLLNVSLGGYSSHPSSAQPAEQTNHTTDYPTNPTRKVTTTDLVSWASQVAAGMEYLASRRILHGDLAARNVLLCESNVVKICDFGLARSLYRNDLYKKSGNDPLPFKWLALECITDGVFSTRSDVWSYGILLWELFSLAQNPYPAMENSSELFQKMRGGYRMEMPLYANLFIYGIMLKCWNEQPELRPTFSELKTHFNAMLPEEIQTHYQELNQPYITVNREKENRGDFDYLSMLRAAEESLKTVSSAGVNRNNGALPMAGSDNLGYERQESQEDVQMSQFQLQNGTPDAHSNLSYMVGVTAM